MTEMIPAYVQLMNSGELEKRVIAAYDLLSRCDVCAWHCPIDRRAGELGVCKTGIRARVSSFGPHMGEEGPLRGWKGSGTIFFTRCNLKCVYCQNHDISQTDAGDQVDPEDLARIMLELQTHGCHNINFVSPSHVVPQMMAGVLIAAQAGLRLPLVYNTGGFDSLEMLQLLDDVIDIYMPDMKYADAKIARSYSKIRDYPLVNRTAVRAMYRQVGDLQIDSRGLAQRGLLVRHLVLPNDLAGTADILHFLADEISPNTYLNLMDQYRPAYWAHQYPDLNRRLSCQEYADAVAMAFDAGLQRLDQRQDCRWISR